MTTVYGLAVSPFVRKVLFCLENNDVEYTLDPVIPIDPPEWFKDISPIGKVPAFKNDELTISDSSVICDYLDSRYGKPSGNSLYPEDRVSRARALWFEELADTKLIEFIGGGLFYERVVKPKFLNEETDQAKIDETLNETLPPILDYLETQANNEYLVGNTLTIADVSIASVFVNGMYASFEADANRWPKLATYVQRIISLEGFQIRLEDEKTMMAGLAG